MNYQFDWAELWTQPYATWLLEGIATTLILGLLSWFLALLLGFSIGTLRTTGPRFTRRLAEAYVEIVRNIPLLVQYFMWYFMFPELLPHGAKEWLFNLPHTAFWTSFITLGIYTSSRVAEHVRAGLGSIRRDQYRAAYATGLTSWQVYRYVIVPYAVRLVIPPLTTEFLTCFKNTSLAMTVGVLETTGAAYQISSYTYHGIESTTAATLVYLIISGIVVLGMNWLERRLSFPGLLRRGG